jgi:hypothetical protein
MVVVEAAVAGFVAVVELPFVEDPSGFEGAFLIALGFAGAKFSIKLSSSIVNQK